MKSNFAFSLTGVIIFTTMTMMSIYYIIENGITESSSLTEVIFGIMMILIVTEFFTRNLRSFSIFSKRRSKK